MLPSRSTLEGHQPFPFFSNLRVSGQSDQLSSTCPPAVKLSLIWPSARGQDMEFDRFSIALLVLRPDSPRLDKEAEAELQDAHMAHLADHEAGYLLAAGPLLGGPDEAFSRADYLER